MKRIIQWQSQHLEIDPTTGKIKDAEEQEDYDSDLEYEDDFGGPEVQNIMSTPFGFWKVDDSMNPYRQFKMWMGHTNFSITSNIVETIKNIPGVEVLQIMTRYRFIIGVGELFNIRDIRNAIETTLKCNKNIKDLIEDDTILQQVYELEKDLSAYSQWAIYLFPNGEIDFTTSEQEDFGSQLNLFKQAVDHSNGILIESEK